MNKNKGNKESNLYFSAAVLFLIASILSKNAAFYPVAFCMLFLGLEKRKHKK